MNDIKQIGRIGLPVFAATCLLAMAGCDSSSSSNNADMQPPVFSGPAQVDQMGRAGVNTAVTDPLFIASDDAQNAAHGEITDRYNSTVSPTSSLTDFTDIFARNLAIYAGADADCSTQLLADDGNPAGRYNTLATVLADDQLYVNTDNGSCDQYFGVELGVAGDCGGRTLTYDVIDVTYSAVTIGAASGVTDGVPTDADDPRNELQKEGNFPFLAAPLTMVP